MMIPSTAELHAMRLDPRELVIVASDHAEPVDPWAVGHYARLLAAHPDHDTDPLLVMCDDEGRKRVRRGRHRLLANLRAGRASVRVMVYQG